VHPCGGWTWNVVRLGADIGLVCETCGRRVLLERSTLEKRLKTILARGPEPSEVTTVLSADTVAPQSSLDLRIGEELRPVRAMSVRVICYHESSSEAATGRLTEGDVVRVASLPPAGSAEVIVEPVEYKRFETVYVPGGVRARKSYTGYALILDWLVLARDFVSSVPKAVRRE